MKPTATHKKRRLSTPICCVAGAEGIEPSSKVLETSVLPLNQAPRFQHVQLYKQAPLLSSK